MLAASRAAVVGVLVFACFDVGHAGRRRVMPWLCLERCNASAVQSDLAQVREHASVLTAVSYEAFNLGPDAGFVDNGFTRANTSLRDLGLELYPMITSANIEYMRVRATRADARCPALDLVRADRAVADAVWPSRWFHFGRSGRGAVQQLCGLQR